MALSCGNTFKRATFYYIRFICVTYFCTCVMVWYQWTHHTPTVPDLPYHGTVPLVNMPQDNTTAASLHTGLELFDKMNATRIKKHTLTNHTEHIPVSSSRENGTFYVKRNEIVTRYDFHSIINQANICNETFDKYGNIFLLALVHSAPENFENRSTIRKTWGSFFANAHVDYKANNTSQETVTAVLVFLIGKGSQSAQAALISESNYYHDIIQDGFLDTYENLTVKSLMGLRWATSFCPRATYVMKTDDDMILNITKILELLFNLKSTGLLIGAGSGNTSAQRTGKWKMTKEQFPYDTLPDYVSGSCYVMSMDVASRLAEVSQYVPILPVEDVYITGVVAKIANITPQYHPCFRGWTSSDGNSVCYFIEGRYCGIHVPNAAFYSNFWIRFIRNQSCFKGMYDIT